MIEEKLREISDRVRNHSSSMVTEEAVKTAVVLPFLSALGYEVFNPGEVIPEFTADAVGKKGERVDYAIKVDGKIRILIGCKPITTNLERVHLAQLYRYFSVTEAKFAVLTNGRSFQFHTDLESPNKLDDIPFLTIDLSDLNTSLLPELKKFARDGFDIDGVLQSASRLKQTSAIKKRMNAIMDNPPDDFIRMLITDIYDGRFTAATRDNFAPLVRNAFTEIMLQSMQSRIASAFEPPANQVEVDNPETVKSVDRVVTTEEEKEGYLIVRAIARSVLPAKRIFIRDQQSYCSVLVDDTNRKPLAKLWFNRPVKYISLFDGEKEDRVQLASLDDIYDHSERIRITSQKYL